MKQHFSAFLFSVAIVLSAIIIGYSYLNRANTKGNISVTGLGEKNFTSDLIVWEGNFTRTDWSLPKAFSLLKKDKREIASYIRAQGIPDSEVVFSSVTTIRNMKSKYTSDGKFMGTEFNGYKLMQNVKIESKKVEKVEALSRQITELLKKGIEFYSEPPRYYYTKLSALKIEMISRATEDARTRALKIAENSGAELGKLISAKMGVFQITGQNSGEPFTWAGAFNVSSKKKTASITMKLTYEVK